MASDLTDASKRKVIDVFYEKVSKFIIDNEIDESLPSVVVDIMREIEEFPSLNTFNAVSIVSHFKKQFIILFFKQNGISKKIKHSNYSI